MPLDLNELRELLAAINQTDIAELTLKSTDFELTVRRGVRLDPATVQSGEAVSSDALPPPILMTSSTGTASKGLAESASSAPAQSTPPPTNDRRLVEVTSPMVGTFYRAPGPEEPPFVEVGDRIRRGQAVCIIEAMKLMNEIEAEVAGEIAEILVQNGEPVEYGQLLMRVNPD